MHLQQNRQRNESLLLLTHIFLLYLEAAAVGCRLLRVSHPRRLPVYLGIMVVGSAGCLLTQSPFALPSAGAAS